MIVNGFKPLTIITKCSILDLAAALDPPLEFSDSSMDWVLHSRDIGRLRVHDVKNSNS